MSGAAAAHAPAEVPAQAPTPPRLRVSHVWAGEVMDDIVVAAGEPVTLGPDHTTTFTTTELALPPAFEILRPGSRGYILTLSTGMTGQLRVGGEEIAVADFVRQGGGAADGSEGGFRATPVGTGDWGVIHLDGKGDQTFFFQFVNHNPLPPGPLWVLGPLLAPALAFAIVLHGIFVTASCLLIDDGHSFLYPGGRELMTAYLVERPPEPEPEPEVAEDKGDDAAGREDLVEKVEKPAATKGKKGKAGGEGDKRAADPDPAAGKPDAPKVALNKRENLKTMEEVADMAGMEKAFGKALAGLRRDRPVVGDSGRGKGSGTGAGDDKDGTGTTRGAKKGGTGGGGKANQDVVTQKDMKTGGERPGKGRGGKKLKEKLVFGSSGGDFSGGLSRADVNRVMNARKGSFRACYQQAVNRTPGLSGTVTLRFTIRDRGKVGVVVRANIVAGKSSLRNSSVHNCILRKVKGLRFPAKGGAIVTSYPLGFSQG